MIKNVFVAALLMLFCSDLYGQQVVVPITTYVPETVVTPSYTVYRPVTTYYYYHPVVAPPMVVAPPYVSYIVQERWGLFGCSRTYVNVIPNTPVFTYGNQNIKSF